VAVGEAFPTGLVFLLAKSSFSSLKTPMVPSQQERANPVGKAFANRIGVFANSLVSCCEGWLDRTRPIYGQNSIRIVDAVFVSQKSKIDSQKSKIDATRSIMLATTNKPGMDQNQEFDICLN
jgi:hypothetical protein